MGIKSFLQKIKRKLASRRLTRDIASGVAVRGRTINPEKIGKSARVSSDGLIEGVVEMTGALSAKVYRANGRIENLGVIARKKVTTAFVNYLVDSLQNSTTAPLDVFKYHDMGTGITAESNTDTALQTPWGGSRVAGTQVEGASANIFKTVATLAAGGTFAITEHGVFSAATSGTLMDRSVFSAINVVDGDSIQFTYELTANAEA